MPRDVFGLADAFGPPQAAALILLLQRGLEELHSQRNTRRLLAQGAHEEGRDYYPVVATTHLAWIAGIALLISPGAALNLPALLLFLALQPVRYWIIATLGRLWTHRIIAVPDAALVTRGPYRFMSHPNYAVSVLETALLPLAFGQLAFALLFTAVWGAVLRYKISLEDGALAPRRGSGNT
jgi:methyltransferase